MTSRSSAIPPHPNIMYSNMSTVKAVHIWHLTLIRNSCHIYPLSCVQHNSATILEILFILDVQVLVDDRARCSQKWWKYFTRYFKQNIKQNQAQEFLTPMRGNQDTFILRTDLCKHFLCQKWWKHPTRSAKLNNITQPGIFHVQERVPGNRYFKDNFRASRSTIWMSMGSLHPCSNT